MTTAPEADDLTPDELAREGGSSASGADSPGQQLRQAREARGLDVSQLAASLRIAPQVVEALEQDDYARLPSAVFVSGYIRSYARLVGLDPEPLNQRFRRLHPDAEPPPRHVARSDSEEAEHEGAGLGAYLVAVLVILAVLAGGYGWWISRPGQVPAEQVAAPSSVDEERIDGSPSPATADGGQMGEQQPLSAQPSSTETDTAAALDSGSDAASMSASDQGADSPSQPQVASADVVVAEQGDQGRDSAFGQASDTETAAAAGATTADAMDDSSTGALGGDAEAQAPASAPLPFPADPSDERLAGAQTPLSPADRTTTDTETEAAAEATEAASDTATGVSTSRPVALSFSGTCWVDIRDSSGEVLLFGEMSRGDREVLGGEPPYSLVIGNASAAELTVADQAYDLDSVARGNVARFELDPAEFIAQSATPSPDTAVDPND